MGIVLKGWRYVGFLSVLAGAVGITLYPIIFEPMMNTEKYKKIQQQTRAGINQEDIQPGNMKVWTDPFSGKK